MKQLILFFFGLLVATSAWAQDPTLRVHQNMRRSGNFGLFSKQDSANVSNLLAKPNIDTSLFVRKANGARLLTTAEGTKLTNLPANALDASTYNTNRTADLQAATNPANLVQTATYRFTTDAEKATWNGYGTSKMAYSDSSLFVRKLAGTRLFTLTEAGKLAGLPTSAVDASTYAANRTADQQAATNPANLVQNATYRFTTDSEKASWNAKEGGLGNPSVNGYILSSSASGVRTWIPAPSGGGGATTNAAALTDGTLDDARLSTNVIKSTTTYTDPSWLTINGSKVIESTTKRFTTDTEKATWNAKANAFTLNTINGQSLFGTGDIIITGGSGTVTTNASSLTAGVLDDARLSSNIVKVSGTYSNPGWISTLDASKVTESATKRFATDTEKSTWNGYGTSKMAYTDSTLFVRKLANTRLFTLTEASKLAGLPTSAVDATTYGTNRTADQADIANRLLTSTYNSNRTTDQAAVAGKASLTGATFTGVVSAPTAATNTATDQVATTLYTANELKRWFQDSLTTYGPGFDPAQFVRVDSAGNSFVRIKSGIFASTTVVSGGGGSGTVDATLSASSTNAVSNSAVTNAINTNTANIAANSSVLTTLLGTTLTPSVSNFTATPGTTTVALAWSAAQTSAAPIIRSVPDVTNLLLEATGTTRKLIIVDVDSAYGSGPTINLWDGTNLLVLPTVKRN